MVYAAGRGVTKSKQHVRLLLIIVLQQGDTIVTVEWKVRWQSVTATSQVAYGVCIVTVIIHMVTQAYSNLLVEWKIDLPFT